MYQPGGSSSTAGDKGSSSIGVSESQPYSHDVGGHGQSQPTPTGATESPGSQSQPAPGGAMEQLGEKAGEVHDRAREKIQDVTERARKEAGAMFQRVKSQGENVFSQGKDRAAEGISRFAVAVLEAADRLRQEGDHNIAGYAEDLSNQLDRAARYLHEHDVRGMMNDLGNTVRRRPGLFFAGMLVCGLVAARILKASRADRFREGRGFDRESDWTGRESHGQTAGPSSGFQSRGEGSGLPDDAMAMAGASPSPASPGISPGYGTSPGTGAGPEVSPSQCPPGHSDPSEKQGPKF